MSIQVLCPFFFFLDVDLYESLYIRDTNPLLDISFAKYLLPFKWPFCFINSFAVQKLLSLTYLFLLLFILSYFYFCFFFPIVWRNISKTNVKEHTAYIFFWDFLVSNHTFKYLIHFAFVFVYDVRKCSNSILLYVALRFSQHHLLKTLFSSLYILLSHSLIYSMCFSYFCILYSIPRIYVSDFVLVPYYFDYCSFVV